MRRILTALALSVLVAAAAATFSRDAARAHYDWNPDDGYMFRNSDCTDKADPINLMFHDGGDLAPSLVEVYLGWTGGGGGTMYIKDHGQCSQESAMQQRESAQDCSSGHCSNDHIRLWPGKDSDVSLGVYEGAGVHVDTEGICEIPVPPYHVPGAHLASDFSDVRDKVAAAFADRGSGVQEWAWNNKYPGDQGIAWNRVWYTCAPSPLADGVVLAIDIPVPGIQGMSYSPTPADLWVCNGSNCDPTDGEGVLILSQWLQNDTRRGIGSYSFVSSLNRVLLDAAAIDGGLLGSTGRTVTTDQVFGPSLVALLASSSGDASNTGPWLSGRLAALWLAPTSAATVFMRPTKHSSPYDGFHTGIVDVYCTVKDIFGGSLPGSLGGGVTRVCGGADVFVHMLEADVNHDCRVDVQDDQAICMRYGSQVGLSLYDSHYDLEPQLGDGDIDIKDLQFVLGRNYSTCKHPYPANQRAGGG